MRIVIDARESGTSTGRYVDKLIENLHALKPRHEVLLLAKTKRSEFLRAIAPDFKIVVSNYPEFSFAEQIGLAWQAYNLRADLVHFTMPQQPLAYFGATVTNLHDLTTVRYTNPAKNKLLFKLKQLVYKCLIVWVAHKSRVVLAISEYAKRDIASYTRTSLDKFVVTYPAADKIAEAAEPITGVRSGEFIMYVGRPLPHKNLQSLIDAFSLLQKDRPKLQLVLAGKKDVLYGRFEKQIEDRAIKNVIFTDFISEGQLRWLYENTAAYVFPSLSEGFGLPGLEAMVHGAPVVSSSATCLPEIYGDAAHYFEPTDIDDMVAAISGVLDNESIRAELVKKGFAQASKFSWRRMAEQTLEVYEKVLK